eukprot:TRINITY_DN24780_c0_g1_i1.p1 TRINITY_DN24780_c0_g1~~TRINITY_DN24780_c0_g1_i1.p1  ORF type:complete len:188 (+),score=43.24 TRINITY_DN24780_c0_g1_i1:71-565(+)
MSAGILDIRLDANASLNKEQLEKVADNFRLLDRDKDGKLTVQEVGILFRAFGQNPTDEELAEMLRVVPSQGVDIDGFVQFFTSNYRTPTSEDTLVRAFQVFDLSDSGIMDANKFKEMLTSLGEPMPQEEVDAILREADVDERGLFNYKSLAQRLCEGPKRIPDL